MEAETNAEEYGVDGVAVAGNWRNTGDRGRERGRWVLRAMVVVALTAGSLSDRCALKNPGEEVSGQDTTVMGSIAVAEHRGMNKHRVMAASRSAW